jgi:hypothetical protein
LVPLFGSILFALPLLTARILTPLTRPTSTYSSHPSQRLRACLLIRALQARRKSRRRQTYLNY